MHNAIEAPMTNHRTLHFPVENIAPIIEIINRAGTRYIRSKDGIYKFPFLNGNIKILIFDEK
ncbi:hypothetical protein [Paracoccus sp. JM45]|uniref:hypothetical protein n=1 Tax=Paracoccus sp. JM45 TaxID=2283626 RepID=UPI0016031D90|nr:hypothetical protein [Paracoccus sp. JM45]